jgi:hypothetical protein
MIALDFNGPNGNSLMVVDMRQWNQVLEHHLWKMLRFFVFLFGFPFSLILFNLPCPFGASNLNQITSYRSVHMKSFQPAFGLLKLG